MQLWNVLLLPQIPLRCLSMELFFLITAEALSFAKLSFQAGVFDIFVAGSMHQRPVSVVNTTNTHSYFQSIVG